MVPNLLVTWSSPAILSGCSFGCMVLGTCGCVALWHMPSDAHSDTMCRPSLIFQKAMCNDKFDILLVHRGLCTLLDLLASIHATSNICHCGDVLLLQSSVRCLLHSMANLKQEADDPGT